VNIRTLRREVERLEAARSGGGWPASLPPCDECGWRGPDDDSDPERYVFTWEGGEDYDLVPRDEHGEAKEYCGTCGRKLVWFPNCDDEAGHFYYFIIPMQ
jgi:hypothetical protein